MEECVRCHRAEEEIKLFDVIYGNEMVKMCERCAILEEIPIIKKPTTSQLKEAEKNYSVYQRLKRMAGLEKKEEKHETILSRIKQLDENPELEMPEKTNTLNLVHNFHWYIMRARRNKGLSQRQLAMLLGESEEAIKMIERGELPGEPEILIKKLEQFFQIRLKERTEREIEEEKKKFRESSFIKRRELETERETEATENEPEVEILNEEEVVSSIASGIGVDIERDIDKEKIPARVLNYNPDALKNLTLSDLQKMKEEREKAEKIIKVGEGEFKAEDFVKEAREEEKRKRELREKIADEMKYEASGKREDKSQVMLGRRELLKKRDYVPSISELAARKKERELLEEPSLSSLKKTSEKTIKKPWEENEKLADSGAES